MNEMFRRLRRVLATTLARGGGIAQGIAVFGLTAGLSGCSPAEGPLELKVAARGYGSNIVWIDTRHDLVAVLRWFGGNAQEFFGLLVDAVGPDDQ